MQTKIKICGLFRAEDIVAVNNVLPDFIGFVFAQSTRQVSIEQALKLRENLNQKIIPVGVFVNASIKTIREIVDQKIIDMVQLHGDEDEDFIKELKQQTGVTIIKAFNITNEVKKIESNADFLLFDSAKIVNGNIERGGAGETFNWQLVKEVKSPYFLAGGININNINAAMTELNPYCIDVSSGVETNKIKDADKIAAIVNVIKNQ